MVKEPRTRTGKRTHLGNQRWEGVELLAYKSEGSAPFKDVSRQTLFEDPELKGQLRYFEVAAGGHTTLERHQHMHAVLVLRGQGRCLVGKTVMEIAHHDLIEIPPHTWHQFRAGDEPLGFLCLVNAERDRPQLPSEADLNELRRHPQIAEFIRV